MERRKTTRSSLQLPLRYTLSSSRKDERLALSRDLSPEGLAVILSESLAPSTPLSLEVRLPGSQESISCEAKVIWQGELKSNAGTHPPRYVTGLQLTQISSDGKSRISALVLDVLKQRSNDATTVAVSLLEPKLLQTQRQFVFHKRVFLNDTNAEGNVYFARFFEWQGEAREEFFRENVPDHAQILQSGIRLVTANAWMSFKQSAYLFEEVMIDVKTAHVKQLSLELVFTFIRKATGDVIAHGGQKLAFADPQGASIPIPASIQENAQYFLIDPSPESTEMHEEMRHAKISQVP